MEICVLHMGWKSDEEKYFRCGYALLEYREADKMEYAVRCFSEEDETNMALCWMNPYLAQNFEKGNRLGTAGTDPADGAVSLLPLPTDPSGR